MGWFKKLKRGVKKTVKKTGRLGKKVIKKASKSKLVKTALIGAVPGGSAIYGGYKVAKALAPSRSRSLAKSFSGGRISVEDVAANWGKISPKLPAYFTEGTGGTGILPKGPGGKLQLPWSDPNTPAVLKQFSLDDEHLKIYYRAPKGYVVVRDGDGRPFPMLKWAARKFGLWTPNKKPPISVGEHQALKRADRAVKKIRKAMTTVSRVDRSVSKGGKVKCKKR